MKLFVYLCEEFSHVRVSLEWLFKRGISLEEVKRVLGAKSPRR